MRKREVQDLRKQEISSLEKKVVESKTELFSKEADFYAGKLMNPKELTKIRRDIAQIMTVISEKNHNRKETAKNK
jgi:ribosomal protein L29